MFDDLDSFVDRAMPQLKERLARLVSIPSISQQPEAHGTDCREVCEVVAGYTRELGFDSEVVETGGLPAVIGKLEVDPSLPWVVIYNHLDVQPVDPKKWEIDNPFDPKVTSEKIIGRGATDDKGPMLSTLYAIQYLKESGQLPVNVQIIYETEEESGSTNFAACLQRHREKLVDPESILVSDTIFEGKHPGLTYQLRGVVRATISLNIGPVVSEQYETFPVRLSLNTGEGTVHSGLAGGFAMNPLAVLSAGINAAYGQDTFDVTSVTGGAQGTKIPLDAAVDLDLRVCPGSDVYTLRAKMTNVQPSIGVELVGSARRTSQRVGSLTHLMNTLGTCTNPENGNILIPGLYDGVQAPTAAQISGLDPIATPATVGRYMAEMKLTRTYTDDPHTALINMWLRPTFEVHNINYDGTTATSDVTMRIVPGQTPKYVLDRLEEHLKGRDERIVLHRGEGSPAVVAADVNDPFIQKAYAACQAGYGETPAFVGCGGSIGALPPMQAAFPGRPLVMLAMSLLSDGYHAPNEEFRWDQAGKGIKTMAHYLHSIAEMRTER